MSTRARYLRILSEGIRRYRKVLLPADEGDAEEEDKKFLPKEAADLIEIQNYVIALECLKKGNTGIYLSEMKDGQTYCNHAVFLTVIAADSNYTAT